MSEETFKYQCPSCGCVVLWRTDEPMILCTCRVYNHVRMIRVYTRKQAGERIRTLRMLMRDADLAPLKTGFAKEIFTTLDSVEVKQ